MEEQHAPSSQPQQTTKPKRNKKPLLATLLIVVLVGMVGYGVYVWQQNQVSELNQEVATLKKTQLPQQKYKSYEDCSNNGGVILNTINGQFDACLGGNEDDTGELPQHQAFLQYSAQNLPRLGDIIKVDGDPNNLTDFIKASNSSDGCPTKLVKEVKDRFAIVTCTDQKDIYDIAIKLSDGWRYIVTTNNMNEKAQPSCLVVDMFKVSKEISPTCFENTGYNNGKTKKVTYP